MPNDLVLNESGLTEVSAEVQRILQSCPAVKDDDTCTAAMEWLKKNKAAEKWVHDLLDDICEGLFREHRKATSKRKALLDPLVKARAIVDSEIIGYRKRKEQERLIKEREQAALLEQSMGQAKAQAITTLVQGGVDVAEAVRIASEGITAPAIMLPDDTPKVEGVVFRKKLKAKVLDFHQLIVAVAEGKVPEAALQYNQSFLDDMARAMGHTLNYPGVVVYEKESTGVTA